MIRKSSKDYSVVFLWTPKVQATKFAFEESSLLCSLLRSQSAHRLISLDSSPDAKYSRTSAFCFFFSVHEHGFGGGPNTFSQEKHRVYLDRAAVNKQLALSIKMKINFFGYCWCGWVVISVSYKFKDAGAIPRGRIDGVFVLHYAFLIISKMRIQVRYTRIVKATLKLMLEK